MSVPYGPSLFLGFRQTERNRISESVIKKICIASTNKTINRMSFQTFESPFFLNTQVLTIWLMLIMQLVRIIDKIGPHSRKTPNPSKSLLKWKLKPCLGSHLETGRRNTTSYNEALANVARFQTANPDLRPPKVLTVMVIKHLIITPTQRRQLAVQNALHPSEHTVPVAFI